MNRLLLTCAIAVGLLLTGGGAALADDGEDTASRCEAFLAKVAEKRGVSVEQLQADLRARVLARIDAAEKAGKLTAEQAAAKRQRVAEATGCKALAKKVKKARGKAKRHAFGLLAGALDYLGLSRAELKEELAKGTTLAELAAKLGKSVSGLEDAMLAKVEARLAQAVADGTLTDAERDAKLQRLQQLVDRLVDKSFAKKSD